MSRRTLLVLIFSLAACAQAYTTFNTTCTKPASTVNFVSSADARGTIDILWSCLFTIIACTWTVQHLNLPEQRDGRDPGWIGDIKWMLKKTWMSTKWMVIIIIAPEAVIGKYWADVMDARHDLAKFQRFARKDGVEWSLTHSLFANMGGFVLRPSSVDKINKISGAQAGTETDSERLLSSEERGQDNRAIRDSASSQDLEMQSMEDEYPETPDNSPLYKSNTEPLPKPFFLLASDILAMREHGKLSKLPRLTKEEINDKSKGDSFTRTITIIQILWLVVQVIARTILQLPISQLETATVAFSACAILMYALSWEKPKGVEVPYTLMEYDGSSLRQPLDLRKAMKLSDRENTSFMRSVLLLGFEKEDSDERLYGPPISNMFNPDWKETDYGGVGLVVGGALFGALHLTAWNQQFPTYVELFLWRFSSIWCTAVGPTLALVALTVDYLDFALKPIQSGGLVDQAAVFLTITVPSFIYILARIYLTVEMFRTLLFLPPGAYKTTWASNIPHLG